MGCNCGKKTSNLAYEAVLANGTKKVYRTEVEARAAVIRSGGGYVNAVAKT